MRRDRWRRDRWEEAVRRSSGGGCGRRSGSRGGRHRRLIRGDDDNGGRSRPGRASAVRRGGVRRTNGQIFLSTVLFKSFFLFFIKF
ncbi:hypothetical protein Scep_009898 [Stephania cephalantha]|uniref:Uncharacterized protein n=1 Tax=Stephania cephalantha TaxID=152367 RepID=A0AAP0JU33_9MAGN